MAYWNSLTEEERNKRWSNAYRPFGLTPEYRNPLPYPDHMSNRLAMAYGKLAASLPDKESVEEFTKWLQPWMAERGNAFKDYDTFKKTILAKSYGAVLEYSTDKNGKKYSDYCKQVVIRTDPKSSIWKLGGIAAENPLDILRLAVITNNSRNYNSFTHQFLRNGTSEAFWNHTHAGALANDIVKGFLAKKGEGLPTAAHLAKAVEKNVKAALQGIEDGSIKGTEGTLWIKEGAYIALSELRGVFKGAYQDPKKNTSYNGDLELDIATNKVGAILHEAGIPMDIERVSPGKDEQLSPERMFELKDKWLQALKEKGYETRDDQTGQPYVDKNDFDSQYLFMDSYVIEAYRDFLTYSEITPSEIPAFTDMIHEWCRENGSLLANEGTGRIEFRERMLTEALHEELTRQVDEMDQEPYSEQFYAAALDTSYKNESNREIFGAGGVDYKRVFEEAVAKTDSTILQSRRLQYLAKEASERLESRENMWDNLHKNGCAFNLSEELELILNDDDVSEDTKQKTALDAIKKQVDEWNTTDPRMQEMESKHPGTIRECVDRAIDLSGVFLDVSTKLKETAAKAFVEKPTNSVAKPKVRTPAINGFGHKDYEHQFESKSQDSMDIAKNKATPSTQKEPEEPKVPKHPERHTPSKSKDFLSR